MQKIIIILATLFMFQHQASAQKTRYLIKLKDKQFNTFNVGNPGAFLTQRSIDRRTRYSLAIDSTDLPVTQRYLDSIRLAGNVEILNTSKWLNQVAIRTSDAAALSKISSFPFVTNVKGIAARTADILIPVNKELDGISGPQPEITQRTTQTFPALNYGLSNGQVKIHRGDFLHNRGFKGEGMWMAILDAGFYHYQTLPTFDSIRLNNQILGTWDFVKNEASVNEDDTHGMQCLSTIGANLPGQFVGTAPKTSFYLYRTEDVFSEYPIEEQNWVAGMERADSLGVNITSTSLGYYAMDDPALSYTYQDMNGNTTISARGADLAAKKGMMCVIAAGNEGNNAWHYIITPADADSVLAVGAVDTLYNVASFSSYGPSSDGQVKPAVAAVGLRAVIANPNTGMPGFGNGTSFACPNMAGIATCLWQAFPEISNMTLIDVLQKSASRSTAPNDRVGYGVPDMVKAFTIISQRLYSGTTTIQNCNVQISFSAKTTDDMPIELQRKVANGSYTTIQTFTSAAPFQKRNFSYADDLSGQSLGPVQYRLMMKVAADTSFFLDSATVMYASSCLPAADSITIGPNPVENNLQIIFQRTQTAAFQVLLTNAAGQRVYQKDVQTPAGVTTLTVPMITLSRGVYTLSLWRDGKRFETRQILKK